MEYLKIKNWEKFQHYKNRCPPWIKLHANLLNKREFTVLPVASKCLLMQLWILGSENEGRVINDLEEIKYRLRDDTIKQEHLNLLIKRGFLLNCKQVLALSSTGQANASPEAEAEAEAEADIKKPEGYALPSKEEINESSIPKIKSDIEKTCKELYECNVFPKANAFANKCLKMKCNPRAVLHTLTRVNNAKPKEPWAYAVKIISVEDGNFNERDFQKTT